MNKNIKRINKNDSGKYDNPQRVKINKNGHKLFGSKANGWWGWKWNREDDSSDEDFEEESILDNILSNSVQTNQNNQQTQHVINFDAIDDDDEEEEIFHHNVIEPNQTTESPSNSN